MDATRLAAITISVLMLILYPLKPAASQGFSVDKYRELPSAVRLIFVAGYVAGFATAAQVPDRAAVMQKCFEDWTAEQAWAVFDKWVIEHPEHWQQSARVGLYAAFAEACGWRKAPR